MPEGTGSFSFLENEESASNHRMISTVHDESLKGVQQIRCRDTKPDRMTAETKSRLCSLRPNVVTYQLNFQFDLYLKTATALKPSYSYTPSHYPLVR